MRDKIKKEESELNFKIYCREGTNDVNVIEGVLENSPEYQADKLDTDPRLIYDVGAHVGSYSVLMRHQFPDAIIKAFELNSENFKYLKLNAKEYGFKAYNIGIIGDEIPKAILFKPQSTASSKLVYSDQADLSRNIELSEELPNFININKLINQAKSTIDILKIDIEGGEFELLKSLDDSALDKVDYIVIEIHSLLHYLLRGKFISPIEFARRLENKGFITEYFRIDDKPWIYCGYAIFRNKKYSLYKDIDSLEKLI